MNDVIRKLRSDFTPPFQASGCSITDSCGYVLVTVSTCMIPKEDGRRLAALLAETLNNTGDED